MRRLMSVKLVTLIAVIVLVALVVPAGLAGTVQAAIPLDCRFWGPVTVSGARVDAGTEITVRILDPETGPSWTTTTFLQRGVPYYVIDIPPDDFPEAGGVDGGAVYFTVTGVTYGGKSYTAKLQGPDATWKRANSIYHPLRVEPIRGDASLDGEVDILDLILVYRIIIGLDEETPWADVNKDGVVDILDMIMIQRIIDGG